VAADRVKPAGQAPIAWLAGLSQVLPDPPVFAPAAAELAAFEAQAELTWRAYLDAHREPVPNPHFEWIPAWSRASAQRARGLLAGLVTQAFRMTPREPASPARVARRAFDLLLNDPQLSREELCVRLSVSEGYLSRRFPAVFGSSLVEQRARTRLVAFLALTMPGGVNLLRASLEAGFGSYAQLHRVFTRHSGFGPREYLSGGGALRLAAVTRSADGA
jgi:AraC-like DNA-binding protein